MKCQKVLAYCPRARRACLCDFEVSCLTDNTPAVPPHREHCVHLKPRLSVNCISAFPLLHNSSLKFIFKPTTTLNNDDPGMRDSLFNYNHQSRCCTGNIESSGNRKSLCGKTPTR